MSEVQWRTHADRDSMADTVASDLAGVIAQALERQETAVAAFPGGETPPAICRRLTNLPVDWGRVTIIPGDERMVSHDSPLSNFAMLRATMGGTGAKLLPIDAVDRLSWPLDLVWLGMGADGHTASIFPGPDLDNALHSASRTVDVVPEPLPPEAPVARRTLSCSAIAAARSLRLVVSGETKKAVLERALAEGAASGYPVGQVIARVVQPLVVHWCP